MNEEAAAGMSNSVWLIGAGVVAAGAIIAGIYLGGEMPEQVTPAVAVEALGAPEAEPEAQTASTEDPSTPEMVATPEAPQIDEVRLEPDGLAVIAGRATPGSEVTVLLDGDVNATTTAGADGSFAAVTVIAPTPDAQVLTLLQDDGADQVASTEEVILAPVAEGADQDLDIVDPPAIGGEAPTVETVLGDSLEEPGHQAVEQPEVVARLDETTEDAAVTTPAQPEDEAEVAVDAATPTNENTEGAASIAANGLDTAEQGTDAAGREGLIAGLDPSTSQGTQDEAVAPAFGQDSADAGSDEATQEPQTDGSRVAVLRNTAEGVELLDASPELMTNVAIDTISYSDLGAVELAGRAQSAADEVRVYLDNDPIAVLEVDEAGRWRGELPEIDSGVYTLRVDEIDATGTVTSRAETPFKREDPGVLTAAFNDDATKAKSITVQTGNTLWGIARERYGEGILYVQVFEANKSQIRNPDLIYPGQVFNLPDGGE
ncbi:MAG: LysM peptidoglycan-binding domain-containing protein [Pseudomonadota bacterium]